MKISLSGLSELRAVCEKGLLLLAITIPEMEVKISMMLSFYAMPMPHLVRKLIYEATIIYFCHGKSNIHSYVSNVL
jgi:hypothetical protein